MIPKLIRYWKIRFTLLEKIITVATFLNIFFAIGNEVTTFHISTAWFCALVWFITGLKYKYDNVMLSIDNHNLTTEQNITSSSKA